MSTRLKDVPVGTRVLVENDRGRGPAVVLGASVPNPGCVRVRYDRPLRQGYADLTTNKRVPSSHIDGWRGDVEVTVLPPVTPDDNTVDA